MGKPTYYNQKDRDQFHEGWFGQAGAEMIAREKDGSLTLGGIHKKQTDAFEPYATRSTMPEGKTPDAPSTMPPGRTLLSRPTGQPATASTIPKIPAAPTPSAPAPVAPMYLGQPRRTLLSMEPLEGVSGRGVQGEKKSEDVGAQTPPPGGVLDSDQSQVQKQTYIAPGVDSRAGSEKMTSPEVPDEATEEGYEHWVKGPLMKVGEEYWQEEVESFFGQYGVDIASAAEEHGVEPEILLAVLTEELSHQIPYLESEEMERLDFGRTVGPAQILVSKWGKEFNLTREELLDPVTSIRTAARILKQEQETLRGQGKEVTPEMLGSRYNYGETEDVTPYGKRIDNFYREFQKKR